MSVADAANGTVSLTFWGRLGDRFQASDAHPLAGAKTVADLRARIGLQDSSVRAVVGGAVVSDTAPLAPGDRVEFLPPVGGG